MRDKTERECELRSSILLCNSFVIHLFDYRRVRSLSATSCHALGGGPTRQHAPRGGSHAPAHTRRSCHALGEEAYALARARWRLHELGREGHQLGCHARDTSALRPVDRLVCATLVATSAKNIPKIFPLINYSFNP